MKVAMKVISMSRPMIASPAASRASVSPSEMPDAKNPRPWKALMEQPPRRDALYVVHDVAQVYPGRLLQQQIHVVGHRLRLDEAPALALGKLAHQRPKRAVDLGIEEDRFAAGDAERDVVVRPLLHGLSLRLPTSNQSTTPSYSSRPKQARWRNAGWLELRRLKLYS
ncbi:MAG TPA: hypothetical protein VGS80_06965 [Ktedonobacterales bacterium]|nr:hypothetical protein [Ktedonobacterales bacterium]